MDDLFEHAPLDLGQNSIRLLQVEAANSLDQRISCRLINSTYSGGRPYCALSYTWGDAVDEQYVLVDGKPLRVRKSVFTFLKFAQKNLRNRYMWIDSICIDQQSIAERNHQVGSMGEIYRNASQVYVWLWPVAANVELLFKMLHTTSAKHAVLRTVADPELRIAISMVKDLPYWSRAWVVQELFLADQIDLVCGGSTVAWRKFWAFLEGFSSKLLLRTFEGDSLSSVFDINRSSMWEHRRRRTMKFAIEKGATMGSTLSLTSCSDIRDRVYSLLSIVEHGRSFPVDYSEDSALLAHRAWDHFRVQDGVSCEEQSIHLLKRLLTCLEVNQFQVTDADLKANQRRAAAAGNGA